MNIGKWKANLSLFLDRLSILEIQEDQLNLFYEALVIVSLLFQNVYKLVTLMYSNNNLIIA